MIIVRGTIVNRPAIVAIAYNRPDSLNRLLKSLSRANYPSDGNITLVISIDKSDCDDVNNVADDFEWEFGDKVVIKRPERMGLRAHVLACGDLTGEYGSIIVLEDDLYVSPMFYQYSVKALDFTEKEDRIGSISLYNHLFNVHVRKSFRAIDDGFDNWYFQMASSWGQAYSKTQWDEFRKWYSVHEGDNLQSVNVPANVASWSDKSWLKYFITYLIDTEKYAFYPRVSYTTNFGDVGSHAVKADADLQVPLAGDAESLYLSFSSVEKSKAVYDSFFENVRLSSEVIKATAALGETLGTKEEEATVENGEVIIDLYGYKPVVEMMTADTRIKYALTSQCLPYKIIKTYGRQMRPVDANVVYDVAGEDYYLYDLSKQGQSPKKACEGVEFLYEYRGISLKQMLKIIKYRVRERISEQ